MVMDNIVSSANGGTKCISPARKRGVCGFNLGEEPPQGCHMAHSYSSAVFHIVFSTKGRADLIPADILEQLWKYVTGIARNHDMQMIAVGGTENHIHILLALPARIALSD